MVSSRGLNQLASSSQDNEYNQDESPISSPRRRLGRMTREEKSNVVSDDLPAAGRRKSQSRKKKSSSKSKRYLSRTEPAMQVQDAAAISPTNPTNNVQQGEASAFQDPESQSKRYLSKPEPTKQVQDYTAMLPTNPTHRIQQGGARAFQGSESPLIQLREQLVALKVRNRDLEEELAKVKAKLKKEREAIQNLEEENIDIQHDLAESKRINARMEKENRMLRKKVVKRDDENHRLNARIEKLMGVTGDESNVNRLDYEASGENRDSPKECCSPKQKAHRGSVWQLLAEETLFDASSPTVESKGGLLEHFFRSSSTMASLTEISVTTPASANCTYRSQRSLTPPRGGCA
jgi:chromosome segregation ATPase